MRHLVILLVLIVSSSSSAVAQPSYAEKKDADAIATIDRNLKAFARSPSLFDGRALAAGADLRAVRMVLEGLDQKLDVSARAFRDVSTKGRARADARELEALYDELVAYRTALAAAYQQATAAAAGARAHQTETDAVAKMNGRKACTAFRNELTPSGYRDELDWLVNLDDGQALFLQEAKDVTHYKAAAAFTAALCKRPELDEIGAACQHMTSAGTAKEGRYCEVAARGDELVKRAVANLIAHHTTHSGPRPADQLAGRDGWIELEGVASWTTYFSGAQLRGVLRDRYAAVYAAAGMGKVDDTVFARLDEQLAAIKAKVVELAPTWTVPGSTCRGVGCGAAKKAIDATYRHATLIKLVEVAATWKVLTNDLRIPTYREKSGYALLQVKGEPLCQLRQWTVSEKYAGGGRYVAAAKAALGHVRWQRCK